MWDNGDIDCILFGKQRVVSNRRTKFVWSSTNDSKKGWLSLLQLEEIRRLVESGENNVEAQQEEQNWTSTRPIQHVTEEHIAQNEEDEGRGEENSELLMNYYNIDTVVTQYILEKIVELMKKEKLSNPPESKKNW